MTIANMREICKTAVGKIPRDVFIITILIAASLASFGLGYLTGLDAVSFTQVGQGNAVTTPP